MSSSCHKDLLADGHCSHISHEENSRHVSLNRFPAHMEQCCSYCGEDNPQSLAMCTACSMWFCNGGYGTSGSHIVLHLVKRKHRSLRLHAKNPIGDSFLECYVCRSTNVFLLGFIPSKEESVVVLVCREPCLHSKVLRDFNWDSTNWLPLIEERRLLQWICMVPNTPRKTLTLHEITTMEASWDTEKSIILDNFGDVSSVPLRFEDGNEYKAIFSKLVTVDSLVAKEQKELTYEGVSCRLQKVIGKTHFFVLKQFLLSDLGVRCGDYATICVKDSTRLLRGVIVDIVKLRLGDEEFIFKVKPSLSAQDSRALNEILAASTVNFRPEYDCIVAKRMIDALEKMVNGTASLSAYLYFTILGQEEKAAERFSNLDIDLSEEPIPKLNLSQDNAVRKALKSPLTLIQGPPGTGKTSTCVALVYQLYTRVQSQILVCAPSNVAVDHIAERISAVGLKTVRVQASYRDVEKSPIKHLVLLSQVEDFIRRDSSDGRMKKLQSLIDVGEALNEHDFDVYSTYAKKIEKKILSNADVICCTCVGAGDLRLRGFCFKHVLIDEATQATEPETIIPLVCGAKQVFLVGDHCQLRPLVFSPSAEKAGLRRSLFERLLVMDHKAVRLDVQYRMHPALSLFPSNYFYEGTLQNGVTEEQRDASTVFKWPDPTKPIFFYNVMGPEELGENGTSYLNRSEAALTEQIVTRLIRDGKVRPNDIGVITPYRSQCRCIMSYFARCGALSSEIYDGVEVSSVDAFQGREKEFIILSCVRSNHRQGIGFVVDWRRLNVSLTRAKRGIIIMGNVYLLSRYKPWHALLKHLMDMSLLVDGSIDSLSPSRVVLHKPRGGSENNDAVDR